MLQTSYSCRISWWWLCANFTQNRTGFAADFYCAMTLSSHYIKYRNFSPFVKFFLLPFVTTMQCTFTVKNYFFFSSYSSIYFTFAENTLLSSNAYYWEFHCFTIRPSTLTLLDHTEHVSSLMNFLVLFFCLFCHPSSLNSLSVIPIVFFPNSSRQPGLFTFS